MCSIWLHTNTLWTTIDNIAFLQVQLWYVFPSSITTRYSTLQNVTESHKYLLKIQFRVKITCGVQFWLSSMYIWKWHGTPWHGIINSAMMCCSANSMPVKQREKQTIQLAWNSRTNGCKAKPCASSDLTHNTWRYFYLKENMQQPNHRSWTSAVSTPHDNCQ